MATAAATLGRRPPGKPCRTFSSTHHPTVTTATTVRDTGSVPHSGIAAAAQVTRLRSSRLRGEQARARRSSVRRSSVRARSATGRHESPWTCLRGDQLLRRWRRCWWLPGRCGVQCAVATAAWYARYREPRPNPRPVPRSRITWAAPAATLDKEDVAWILAIVDCRPAGTAAHPQRCHGGNRRLLSRENNAPCTARHAVLPRTVARFGATPA